MSEWPQSICVLGLGYIGLPTASLLATKGFHVHGVDVREEVVRTINSGRIHISEPELDVLVRSAVQSGRLKASPEPVRADVFIIAVPTPFKDDHIPDLSYVEAATQSLAPFLEAGNLVILESTSPVGTTERIGDWITEIRPDLGSGAVSLAHCPERVLPGRILQELVENDRIVGGTNDASTETAAAFYREFVSGDILTTDARTAELAKLSENTFRDVNIALANELSVICDELEINVWELIGLANHHPRVNILQPGPGVGGHCIAVDPWFIVDSAPDSSELIRTAREVNSRKPQYVVDRVLEATSGRRDAVVACLGLSYKANVGDLRESPALEIVRRLTAAERGRVLAVEPNVEELPDSELTRGIELVSLEYALSHADVLVGLVDHRQFRELDSNALRDKHILDTRGMWRSAT